MQDLIIDGDLCLYGTVGVSYFDEGFGATGVVQALARLGRTADVRVRINSGGGIATEGAAIYAILKAHRGKVTVIVEGIAASAASVIAMAGDEVLMSLGATMMIHDPSGFTFGTAVDHAKSIEALDVLADGMSAIYAERTGETAEAMRAVMREELWLTAADAVARKFADRIAAANDDVPVAEPEPAAFPYAAYAHAPERFTALASARGWSPRPLAAAVAALTAIQEPTMSTAKPGTPPAPVAPTPAPAAAAAPAPAAPAVAAPGVVVSLDSARAEGRVEALAYVREVNDLCALAKQPGRAMAFVEANTPVADVRKALLDDKAAADEERAVNGAPPVASSAPRPRLAAKMAARFNQKG